MHPIRHAFTCCAASAALSSPALAGQAETWSYDLMTTGEDVFYTSSTAVDPDAASYEVTSVLESVIVEGLVFGFVPTGPIDVTDQVPAEFQNFTTTIAGPAPVLIFNDTLQYPEPPEDPGFAATFEIALDEQGLGQLAVTDVLLGTVEADVPDFGTVTVTVTSVRVVGQITVDPAAPAGPAEDLDRDGVVGVSDLLELLAAWGRCSDTGNCPADFDSDGSVGVSDLLQQLAAWG